MRTLKLLPFIFICLFGCLTVAYAQSPEMFNYQAVVRNNGNPIVNDAIDLRFTIRNDSSDGTILYQETHDTTTNNYGLVSVPVGGGTITQGNWAAINWGAGKKYLQVELDYGPGGFDDLGAQQLLSVPYALHSGSSGGGGVWSQNGSNVYYNAGNVGIGTNNPNVKLVVQDSGSYIAAFSGLGTNNMYVALFENGNYLGYWGSYSGASDDVDFGTGSSSSANVHLVTGATPRLTINSTGLVGIGTTSPLSDLDIDQSGGSTINEGTGGINLRNDQFAWRIYNSNDYIRFNYSSDTGNTYTPKSYIASSNGSYNLVSDASMKMNIEPMENLLTKIIKLKPVRYHYKDVQDNNRPKEYGFLAQDVQKLFPVIVSHEKGGSLLGINYSAFGVIAIKAIQEQQSIINRLKAQLQQQQKRMDTLEKRLKSLESN